MLKELIEKRNAIQDKMQAIVDKAKVENRVINEEEKAQFDAYEKEVKDIDNHIAAEEAVQQMRKRTAGPVPATEDKEVKAFENFLRGIVNTDAPITMGDNGALIPSTIANKIIDKVMDLSPVFAMAERYNVKGNLSIPYVDESASTLVMAYATEFVEPDAGKVKTASIELTGYLAEALAKVSKSLINNSQFDIVGFVVNQIAKQIAKFIDKELLVGSDGKITGLSGVTTKITAASATAVTADELIDLQESVSDVYQADSIWIMNKATRTAIRKLKDSDGNYLLNKDVSARWGYTLLGKDVYTADGMPTMTTGKTAVYYGDMSGLAVKVSEEINTQVLTEKYAVQHAVGIVAFVEMDAKVQDQQKLSKLVMA